MANEKKTEQTFTFEVVSCLLAAMLEHGVILGNRHFSMMAQLDSSKTASGYEHTFRAAKARAKEINASKGGEDGVATPTGRKTKAPAATTPQTGGTSGKKRGMIVHFEFALHPTDMTYQRARLSLS
jgi:hypothetical protein